RPGCDVNDQRQCRYARRSECEEADKNSENSDDEMETPVGIRGATCSRANNAKYSVDQHPGSEQQHKGRQSQTGVGKRDNAENNSTDAPYHQNPPITF